MIKQFDKYNDILEFHPEYDPFMKSRRKGATYWILHHIFYRINSIIVFTWLSLVVLSAFLFAKMKQYIGNAIDALKITNEELFRNFLLLILLFGVLSPIIDLVANMTRELLAQRLERDARYELYVNLLGKSQSFHDRQKIGDIMARATNDVRQLNYLISPALSLIFEAFINVLLPIILIIRFYPLELLITPLIFSILFIYTLKLYVDQLGPVSVDLQMEYGNLNSILNESLAGIEIVKGMAQEETAKKRYEYSSSRYKNLGITQGKIQARYIPILLVALAVTGGLIHGIILYYHGSMTIGDIIAYVGLLGGLRFPTNISIWAFAIVRRAWAGAERLLGIMNQESEISESASPLKREIEGNIKFENVSFHYPGSETKVLEDISFEVYAGQTVAIVGTTGSGKTTVTKLISRLYDIDSGCITLDGFDLQKYSFHSLRDQISYIEQDIFLFSKNIYENILFGRKASKDAVIKAAKDAQAHDFILKLPKGYETSVGERGVQLSGGERQRIAIARAFLSNPKILILDDSTSAIDSETEEKIQYAITQILKGRTTFIITHRLSQIRWADKILVLSHGRIKAQGSHEELLRTCEEYRKIFVTRFDKSLDELLEAQT
ncbi:MAG: ABC transporter ATP-binding protein [Promethearchaeota archaeon]